MASPCIEPVNDNFFDSEDESGSSDEVEAVADANLASGIRSHLNDRSPSPRLHTCFYGRCRCISKSAKTLRSVSKITDTYNHSRVEDAVHKSHTESGITELRLGMRHLGSNSTLPIIACIQSQPLIADLDLSYNSLEEKGGIDLVLALVTNRYVTNLNVSGNRFGKTKLSAYLMILLSHNNILKELNLSSNGFDDRDVYFVAGGIMENNYLVCLDLSSNYIGEAGAGFMGRAVAINNTLESLNLAQNCIRLDGGILMGKSVMFNNALVEINLRGNGLAYHGALSIRQCLLKNKSIKKIDISNNRINWEGAIVLAHGLEVNETLETFIAGDNPLTTTGCMDLIDAVSSSCTLKTLDLSNVNVVKEFRQVVRTIEEVHKEFKVIHGQIVNSHDILGLRRKRRLHPMVKIVTYLFDRELRPVELLRMMDKTVSFKLTPDEFFYRCHTMGIDIKLYEKDELMDYVLSEAEDRKVISYSTMLEAIERFIEQERLYRLDQRKKASSLTKYQRYLLDRHLPQVSANREVNEITKGLLDKLHDTDDKNELITKHITKSVLSLSVRRRQTAFRSAVY